MIKKATNSDIFLIREYLKSDPISTVYISADIDKYGLNKEFLDVWLQFDSYNNISSIIMRYYEGVQFYSKFCSFDIDEICSLLLKISPQTIGGQYNNLIQLKNLMSFNYKIDTGFLAYYNNANQLYTSKFTVKEADISDIEEIGYLICSDQEMSKIYTPSDIEEQLRQRIMDGFGRSYIIKVNNEIVAHAATYAETDYSAVIGGVITKPSYRRKGYSFCVVSQLCKDLIKEGKVPCLFYYNNNAGELYRKIGFTDYMQWSKLVKIE